MSDATQQVIRARAGDAQAASELVRLLYDQLRQMAAEFLRRERPDHTLEPTALVHEVYLRLLDQTRLQNADRTYFQSVAAREMRRVLTDHAKARDRVKRGRGWARVILDQAAIPIDAPDVNIVDIDTALNDLTEKDERLGRMVELRFFSGLTLEEIGGVLGISAETVKKDWRLARAWLCKRLRDYE